MLTAIPAGWLSRSCAVVDDSHRQVGEIEMSWRERGLLTIGGATYSIARDGWGGPFVLEQAGAIIARATKAPFRRAFTIEHAGATFTLSAPFFSRSFILRSNSSTPVGVVRPAGLFTRRAEIDAPDDVPLDLRLFAAWLAMVMWRRAARAVGGG